MCKLTPNIQYTINVGYRKPCRFHRSAHTCNGLKKGTRSGGLHEGGGGGTQTGPVSPGLTPGTRLAALMALPSSRGWVGGIKSISPTVSTRMYGGYGGGTETTPPEPKHDDIYPSPNLQHYNRGLNIHHVILCFVYTVHLLFIIIH